MKEIGKMIWRMVQVDILTLEGLSMKENGKMIYKMDMVSKVGLIMRDMRGRILMGRRMAKECFILQMGPSIKENSWKMKFLDMENTFGVMERYIKDLGKIIK